MATGGVSVGGAYIDSTIKNLDPANVEIGAVAGSGASKVTEKISSGISAAVVGSITTEVVGDKVADRWDAREKNNDN